MHCKCVSGVLLGINKLVNAAQVQHYTNVRKFKYNLQNFDLILKFKIRKQYYLFIDV